MYGEENIEIYHTAFTPLEWYLSYEREIGECYCKIIVERQSDLVLGIHYLGPNAGEVMGGYAVAMQCNARYQDLMKTVGIHPTTSEELVRAKFTKRE